MASWYEMNRTDSLRELLYVNIGLPRWFPSYFGKILELHKPNSQMNIIKSTLVKNH